ncbi:MAG: hypothetical protein ACOVRB_09155 [Akkermansiaceae bacterium]
MSFYPTVYDSSCEELSLKEIANLLEKHGHPGEATLWMKVMLHYSDHEHNSSPTL